MDLLAIDVPLFCRAGHGHVSAWRHDRTSYCCFVTEAKNFVIAARRALFFQASAAQEPSIPAA
jgi:hypothetical protein